MFKPYSIVEETPEQITYEFKTIYLWILYFILLLGGTGFVLKEQWLMYTSASAFVLYFLTVSIPYRKLGNITNKAAMEGTVKYSGSKWSFSKPLRVSVPNSETKENGR